jgi:hypothetical protein
MKKIIMMFLFLLPNVVLALPTAKFTLLVVDEQGVPIEGADARISFMKASGGKGSKSYFVSGKTDKEGLFTGQGATEYYATYSANADGYYGTGIKFGGFKGFKGMMGFRKWKPWNPTLKVVLKKIKKPIPMYAYSTDLIVIPKNNETIGYDLVKHDWVSPNGEGITNDFLFKIEYLEGEEDSNNRYFTLNFSNEADGIQPFDIKESKGSSFRSAHHATTSGFSSLLKQSRVWEKGRPISTYKRGDGTNYYFRVRCDGDKAESCLYGKIYGNIEFGNKEVRFKYLLNPSIDDTNVEFDPKRNLFKNLKRKITES